MRRSMNQKAAACCGVAVACVAGQRRLGHVASARTHMQLSVATTSLHQTSKPGGGGCAARLPFGSPSSSKRRYRGVSR